MKDEHEMKKKRTVFVTCRPAARQRDLGRGLLKISVLIANITNEFILGLDILHAYKTLVDLGHQMLRLAEDEVLLWSPAQPGSGQ
jgi:hypothetical protein